MSVENTLCKYQTEKAEGEDREAILLFSSLWYGLQALNLNANASQYININCFFFFFQNCGSSNNNKSLQ